MKHEFLKQKSPKSGLKFCFVALLGSLLSFSPPSQAQSVVAQVDAEDLSQTERSLEIRALERYQAGNFDRAISELSDLFKTVAKRLGESAPEALRLKVNLATIYQDLGRYAQAKQTHGEVLPVLNSSLGPNHPLTLRAEIGLAVLETEIGMYRPAEQRFLSALDRGRVHLGENAYDVWRAEAGLSALFFTLGRYAEAESELRSLLQRQRASLGEDAPETLRTEGNLAVLLEFTSRYEDAEALYRDLLPRQTVVVGEDHPDVLATKTGLARLLQTIGRYEEAEALFRDLLSRAEANVRYRRALPQGGRQSYTFQIKLNLAALLQATGRHDEAETLYGSLRGRQLGACIGFREGTVLVPPVASEIKSYFVEANMVTDFEVALVAGTIGSDIDVRLLSKEGRVLASTQGPESGIRGKPARLTYSPKANSQVNLEITNLASATSQVRVVANNAQNHDCWRDVQ